MHSNPGYAQYASRDFASVRFTACVLINPNAIRKHKGLVFGGFERQKVPETKCPFLNSCSCGYIYVVSFNCSWKGKDSTVGADSVCVVSSRYMQFRLTRDFKIDRSCEC